MSPRAARPRSACWPRQHIVPGPLAEAVARATGFRNVLVHQYTAVDDDAVRRNVALLDDLDAYVEVLATWALQQP